MEKSASPSRGVNGTDINFSITVTNRGGADLGPVYINDSLPPGLDFLDATENLSMIPDRVFELAGWEFELRAFTFLCWSLFITIF